MRLIYFLSLVFLCLGCQGSGTDLSGTSVEAAPTTKAVTMVATQGCSVSVTSGGALITCGDGSSAVIANGSNGAPGPQGVKGPTGSAGAPGAQGPTGSGSSQQIIAIDSNGNQIGDYVVGSPGPSFSVWSNTLGLYAQYQSSGSNYQLPQLSVYYATSDCSGQGYAQTNSGTDQVQALGTAIYKIGNTSASVHVLSYAYYDGANVDCDSGDQGTISVVQTASLSSLGLSDSKIPLSASLPVQFKN